MFFQWIRATWLGFVLAVPGIVAMALLGEVVGLGGLQVLVGAGLEIGVGWLQARALRGVLDRVSPWFWSCVVGLAVPFLAIDIATLAGWSSTLAARSLLTSIALGGLVAGVWQAAILRSRVQTAYVWVLASTARMDAGRGVGALRRLAFKDELAAGSLGCARLPGPGLRRWTGGRAGHRRRAGLDASKEILKCHFLPIANKCCAPRTYMTPSESAGVAISDSPIAFVASALNSGPAARTMMSPSSPDT